MEYVDKNTHMPIRKNAPKCLINWMWNIEGETFMEHATQWRIFTSRFKIR